MVNPTIKERIDCLLEKLPEADQQRIADFADALLKSQPVKGMSGKEFVESILPFDPEAAKELAAILKGEDERQWAMIRWAQENGI